jgi:hypothetical protein
MNDDWKIQVIAFLLFIFVVGLFKFIQVNLFYGGDIRCMFAECRINK